MFRRWLAALIAGTFIVALPAPASALGPFTESQITVPAGSQHLLYDEDAGPAAPANLIAVSGRVAGGGGAADLRCTSAGAPDDSVSGSLLVQAGVPTAPDGSFSTTVSLSEIYGNTCVLRAVPAGSLAGVSEAGAALAPFSGPRLAVSSFSTRSLGGVPYGFRMQVLGFGARASVRATQGGGDSGQRLLSPGLWLSDALYNANARLPRLSNAIEGVPSSRSGIVVDGNNAYSPTGVADIDPAAITYGGAPSLTVVGRSFDPGTGDAAITTEEPVVRCPANVPAGTEGADNCGTFLPTGVKLVRTVSWTRDAQVQSVADHWISTDGRAHRLDLLSSEESQTSLIAAGYRFPWADATYRAYADGTAVAPPPATVSSVFGITAIGAADGDVAAPRGAMTLSTRPSAITFFARTGFELRYVRTVPATGSLPITQTYSTAAGQQTVDALAQQAEAALRGRLAIAITSATQVSGYSTAYTLSGATTTDGGVKSLIVNGAAVTPAPDGTWSSRINLVPGANAISATVTDNADEVASTSGTVTFAPRLSQSEILTGRVSRGILRVKVRCQTLAGSRCSGRLALTARVTRVKRTRRGRRRSTKTITLARRSFAVPDGEFSARSVRLGTLSRKLVRKYRIRRATVTLRQTVGGVLKKTRISVSVKL